jgi:hypothetical protein
VVDNAEIVSGGANCSIDSESEAVVVSAGGPLIKMHQRTRTIHFKLITHNDFKKS